MCGSCEALRASYGLQITPGQHVEGFFVLPKKGASFGIGSGGAILFFRHGDFSNHTVGEPVLFGTGFFCGVLHFYNGISVGIT